MLLKIAGIATKCRQASQDLVPQPDSPVASPLHLLLQKFEVRILTTCGKEPLTVTHFIATLNSKSFSIRVGLQDKQRCERRNDVEFFRETNDLVVNEAAWT